MFLPNAKDKIKIVYKKIFDSDDDICSRPFNFKIVLNGPDYDIKGVNHKCLADKKNCPSTCKYRKEKQEHNMSCQDDNNLVGGYYKKYIKYKTKYLNLQSSLHK
jgi:hypothetical protein